MTEEKFFIKILDKIKQIPDILKRILRKEEIEVMYALQVSLESSIVRQFWSMRRRLRGPVICQSLRTICSRLAVTISRQPPK